MADSLSVAHLYTNKDNFADTHLETVSEPADVQDGEVILTLSRFALTTNNITYAAFGNTPGYDYWQFFPTMKAGLGHMPVWGFADVVASKTDGIEVGERFYGYFPMATHIRMQPERVRERGFYDGLDHRRNLTSPYNQYTRCSNDVSYSVDLEEYQMIFQPLFITSWMLADFITDNEGFGAAQIIISSASSKTAYGTAFSLEGETEATLVGLTSGRNEAFVKGLGCYDSAVTYDALDSLDASVPTLYVDFSGDDALRRRIHEYFGEALVYDCFAGSAQNAATFNPGNLPGPKPKSYFAPVQIKKRNADWGPLELTRRLNEARTAFTARISKPGAEWIKLKRSRGLEGAQTVISELCSTGGDPMEGNVVDLE